MESLVSNYIKRVLSVIPGQARGTTAIDKSIISGRGLSAHVIQIFFSVMNQTKHCTNNVNRLRPQNIASYTGTRTVHV